MEEESAPDDKAVAVAHMEESLGMICAADDDKLGARKREIEESASSDNLEVSYLEEAALPMICAADDNKAAAVSYIEAAVPMICAADDDKLGSRKREIEEEEDSSDDSSDADSSRFYYDSCSSSEYEQQIDHDDDQNHSEEEEDSSITEVDYSVEDKVELFDEDGDEITDDHLMQQMSMDYRLTRAQKLKLIPQLRKYIHRVSETSGFECDGFTRTVWGLTTYVPRQHVIDKRHKYPEAYNHFMYLANFALKTVSNLLSIWEIKQVNVTTSMWSSYKITFTAFAESEPFMFTLQAHVWYNPLDRTIKLGCCGCKLKSTSMVDTLMVEKPIVYYKRLDPVEVISSLKTLTKDKLWEKIKDYCSSSKKKDRLLTKVAVYFDSVVQSKGFKISSYPGHIPGVSDLKPREKIIHAMNRYQECIDHVLVMAKLGLEYYLQESGEDKERYEVITVRNVNVWKESIYYVTFIVTVALSPEGDDYPSEKFQAKLYCSVGDIVVDSCTKVKD